MVGSICVQTFHTISTSYESLLLYFSIKYVGTTSKLIRLPLFYSENNNQATIIYWISCSVDLQFKTTCKLNARHCHSWDLVWK